VSDVSETGTASAEVEAGEAARPRGLTRRRAIGLGAWFALFAALLPVLGVPTDPIYFFGLLWLLTIAWNSDRPWRYHLRFVRDWLPIIALLVVYNLSRGFADNHTSGHVHPLIDADTSMWGWATGGRTPPVWLQHELYDPAHVRWWDLLVSLVYFSHFVTVPTIAVVLWMRDRARWAQFMRRWITLFAAGLVTYFIYPAVPPWLAAQRGLVPDIARISTRGWNAIGLHSAGNLLNAAQVDASNPIAAMPSLHTGFSVLAVAFFLPLVGRRWWPLLLAYPLAMVFTLVYSGEHWVVDAIVGAAYTVVILILMPFVEKLFARREQAGGTSPPQ
jgi:hypothetical protein